MSGLNTGYSIVSQALQAFQAAMDVTSNNIANVNTAGYTRQTAILGETAASQGYGLNPYQIGTGVTVETIAQIQNSLLNGSMQGAQSGLGQYQTLASTLQSVQQAFPEPSANGIGAALSGFFNAWSGLAANPGSTAAKLSVQQAASTLTSKVQSTYGQLQQQSQQVNSQISNTFNQIDQLTGEIAKLNTQIAAQTASNGAPNALLDQRGLDLQKLGNLIDIQTSTNSNGSVNVYSNGLNLVDQGGPTAMPRTFSASSLTFTSGSTSVSIQGGQLAGYVQALNKIQGYQGQLNTLANNLTTQVNAIHQSGVNGLGKTNVQFFASTNPPSGAAGFALSAAVLADPNAIASGASGKPGDGGLALSLAHLSSGSQKALGNMSFTDYYQSLVGNIGTDVVSANNAQTTSTALVTQIQNQQQSVSGVNIDEEMSNMLMYQNSYQAAAKALSVFDQTTNTLIQMV